MKLTTSNIHDTILECMFAPDEAMAGPDDIVQVVGVQLNIGFHPGRLAAARPRIQAMIGQLPKNLLGEGGSFLSMCYDSEGAQWGEHRDMDALLCLGLATDLISYQLPREMWGALPGGMPAVIFQECLR